MLTKKQKKEFAHREPSSSGTNDSKHFHSSQLMNCAQLKDKTKIQKKVQKLPQDFKTCNSSSSLTAELKQREKKMKKMFDLKIESHQFTHTHTHTLDSRGIFKFNFLLFCILSLIGNTNTHGNFFIFTHFAKGGQKFFSTKKLVRKLSSISVMTTAFDS